MKQASLFEAPVAVPNINTIDTLKRPINDWAYAIYILLDSPKGLTAFSAAGTYGVIKFQERINEIANTFDGLLEKKTVKVRKRIRGEVNATQYKIKDESMAYEIYQAINQKNGSKILRKTDKPDE